MSKLVNRFERSFDDYMRADYSEADARSELVDPLFEALGWDVQDTAGRGPSAREVVREKREISGRSDYRFRVDGHTLFFVEAKAPHAPLDDTAILQAKKYAWNEPDPRNIVYFVVLTNFREFCLYDASRKPDPKIPTKGQVFYISYKQYLTTAGLENLWMLSRQDVPESLDKQLTPAQRAARERIPLDQQFLNDLTAWRGQLAKSVFKVHPDLSPADLNRVVQTFLDRLIFIRVAEDRGVLAGGGLVKIARDWDREGRVRPITADLFPLFSEVNNKLNGEIFKSDEIKEISWDSELVAKIIEQDLEPYDFVRIPVELLGSIYERYLGNTIRVTGKGVKIEPKPEVRKAGGVYYTPKYIVDYIVAQTVGKLIDGKSPKQITKIKILDPACGSGSFLLGAYQTLLDYHTRYKRDEARKKEASKSHPRLLNPDAVGEYQLSLQEKADILRNNVFGVDIDAQAVEITMMSLYIKMLEGERGMIIGKSVLPRLKDNIKYGNSLIGYDDGKWSDEEHMRINPLDWESKSEGFGEIVDAGGFDVVIGNPPWGADIHQSERPYLSRVYPEVADFESSQYFLVKGISLLNNKGMIGMIIPNTFALNVLARKCRDRIITEKAILQMVDLSDTDVFKGPSVRSMILVAGQNGTIDCHLYIFRMNPPHTEKLRKISQRNLKESETWKEFFVPDSPTTRLIDMLIKRSNVLADYCDVKQGYIPYRTTTLTRRFGKAKAEEIVKQRLWHSTRRESAEYRKELQGGDVGRYSLKWSGVWVRYGEWVSTYLPLSVFSGPRVVIREITGHRPHVLLSTYVEDVFVHNPSVLAVLPRSDGVSAKFILGVLNSKLTSLLFSHVAPKAKKGLFPKIIITDAKRLPFPRINLTDLADKAQHDKMIQLVERILELHAQKQAAIGDAMRERIEREIHITDEMIDALVYELYGLSQEEIKIAEGGL